MTQTHDDALPVTVLLPDSAGLPFTLYDGGPARTRPDAPGHPPWPPPTGRSLSAPRSGPD